MKHSSLVVTLALCAVPTAWSIRAYTNARAQAAEAAHSASMIEDDLAALDRHADAALLPDASAGLTSTFPSVLQRAGVPAGVLSSLQRTDETSLGKSSNATRAFAARYRIALSGVSLGQLGDIFAELARSQTSTRVVGITVTPLAGSRSSTGTDQLLSSDIVAESLVVEPGSSPQ